MKYVALDEGLMAFRWNCRRDPRGYTPPRGYSVEAALIEHHPATGAFLGESQWWMFLTRKGSPHV